MSSTTENFSTLTDIQQLATAILRLGIKLWRRYTGCLREVCCRRVETRVTKCHPRMSTLEILRTSFG
jgi:hypothetical protein